MIFTSSGADGDLVVTGTPAQVLAALSPHVVRRPVLHARSLDALTRSELQTALRRLLDDHDPRVALRAAHVVAGRP